MSKKVRIRILRATHLGLEGVAVPGDEVDVTQELAQQLVGNGRAEHVTGPIYTTESAAMEAPEVAVMPAPARKKAV